MSGEDAESLLLSVMEAIGNVIRHAAGKARDFSITVERARDIAVVEVLDHGPGFTLHPRPMPDVHAENGRGVPLMQRLCDSVEYSTSVEGNRLVLKKRLRTRAGR